MRSTSFLRSQFSCVAFEKVSVLVWLTMTPSHPFKEERRALPPSTPLSSVTWLCTPRNWLKLLNTPGIPRRKPHTRATLPACLSGWSYVRDSTSVGVFQDGSRTFIVTCQPRLPIPPRHVLGKFDSPYLGKTTATARAALSAIPTNVCSIFMCPNMVWLLALGFFNVRLTVDACGCTQGLYGEHRALRTDSGRKIPCRT